MIIFRIMKCLCFAVSFFIGLTGFGQSLIALDSSNGFKEYKIGMKRSSLEKELKPLDNRGLTNLYKAKEKVEMNGMTGGEIELAFHRGRLVEILIFFRRRTINEYDSLKHSFEQLYGTPKDESNSNNKPSHLNDYDEIFMWEGSVIGLQYNYDVSHKVIEIIYWGLNEKTEKTKEKF